MTRSYGVTNAAPWASAPTVGPAGDTYYNTATKTLYLSDGVAWNAIGLGGIQLLTTAQRNALSGGFYIVVLLFLIQIQVVSKSIMVRQLVGVLLGIRRGALWELLLRLVVLLRAFLQQLMCLVSRPRLLRWLGVATALTPNSC
jgi:hypothetical protein